MRKRPRFTILVGVVAAFIVLFRKKHEYLDSKQIENSCPADEYYSFQHGITHMMLNSEYNR